VTGKLEHQGRARSRQVLRAIALALAVACVFVLSACESNESYKNENKPPAVLTLGVIVADDQIAADPNPFGAGPTRFLITNQTTKKQIVTLTTDTLERKAVVDPSQTANFKMTIPEGNLTIASSDISADSLDVTVGPERESAQQDLNQP
jgi:predicted component of type VI protein secretion system